MSFQEILEFLNFLYSIGMLLEFAAFIKLRIKKPDLHRPYRVPLQTFGATMLCVPPTLLLVLVMCLASLKTFLVSGAVVFVGFIFYPTIIYTKEKSWVRFSTEQPQGPNENDIEGHNIVPQLHQEVADEASVSLLSDLSSSKEVGVNEISSNGVSKLE